MDMHSCVAMATSVVVQDIPSKTHQPVTLSFHWLHSEIKVMYHSFQQSVFFQWPFVHYDEAQDVVYCHTWLVPWYTHIQGIGFHLGPLILLAANGTTSTTTVVAHFPNVFQQPVVTPLEEEERQQVLDPHPDTDWVGAL